MKEIELCNGVKIEIAPENPNEILNVSLTDLYEFELYQSTTLVDVFETIEQSPEEYEGLDVEDILEEIEAEDDYDTFINQNLGNKHRWFLQLFLEKVNQILLEGYPDNIVNGEESFYGEIIFAGDEENIQSQRENIKELQKNVTDSENLLEPIINSEYLNDDIFYILSFSTNY